VWDSSGLRQLALKYAHGYRGLSIQTRFQFQFIHYAAFSKNKHLDESNIVLWRQLMILRKIGHEKVMQPAAYAQSKSGLHQLLIRAGIKPAGAASVSQLATLAYNAIFQHVDKSNPYKGNWGNLSPIDVITDKAN
jgi:hypothetical protein